MKEIRLKRGNYKHWWIGDLGKMLCHYHLVKNIYLPKRISTIFITFSKHRRAEDFRLIDSNRPIKSLPNIYVMSVLGERLRDAVRTGYKYARIEYEE